MITLFLIASLIIIHRAHKIQFCRADYGKHLPQQRYETDLQNVPQKAIFIQSGTNRLKGTMFGCSESARLLVISSGHRCPTEDYLEYVRFFTQRGWMVFCYDYTGYYSSEGESSTDYIQAVKDLDLVLTYFEKHEEYSKMSVSLFGHSLGGYVSLAVLNYSHKIKSVVSASGFDTPVEQWGYSVKRYSGKIGFLEGKIAEIYEYFVYGKETRELSAVNGINSSHIPIMVLSGTTDEFYGGVSSIYKQKDSIKNPKCRFMLMDKPRKNGHYDYLLSDEAIEIRGKCQGEENKVDDTQLYSAIDIDLFEEMNSFLYYSPIKRQ